MSPPGGCQPGSQLGEQISVSLARASGGGAEGAFGCSPGGLSLTFPSKMQRSFCNYQVASFKRKDSSWNMVIDIFFSAVI